LPSPLHPYPTRRSSDLCLPSTCSVPLERCAVPHALRPYLPATLPAVVSFHGPPPSLSHLTSRHYHSRHWLTCTPPWVSIHCLQRDRKSTRLNSSHVSIS